RRDRQGRDLPRRPGRAGQGLPWPGRADGGHQRGRGARPAPARRARLVSGGPAADRPVVGVLALQGDVREHLAALTRCGVRAVPVRRPEELAGVDALVVPGGESTTIGKLAAEFGLLEPVRDRIKTGMPCYGSCAGMIMLASRVLDGRPDQPTFGGIEMAVRRNAFGRQVHSFESPVELAGLGPVPAVFIRAPWVEEVG